nr:unnamed protein product [Spirometra erinaceieuropaei]
MKAYYEANEEPDSEVPSTSTAVGNQSPEREMPILSSETSVGRILKDNMTLDAAWRLAHMAEDTSGLSFSEPTELSRGFRTKLTSDSEGDVDDNIVEQQTSGSRASANNYRPASLTSISCKIMDKIIKKALMQFLEQYKLLSDAQHGFRSGRSCLTNLLFTLERWTKARDEANVVHAIYIDFKKAFHSVPHQRPFYKPRNVGIRGRLLVWIQSFLAGRSQ